MIRSNLCNYSDPHILVSGTITIAVTEDDVAAKRVDRRNKGVIFKSCALFTNCISNINNNQKDNADYIDVVMPVYNLIEYGDNYPKISGSLSQYCRDEPNANITESDSFKFKTKITGKTPDADNKKNVQIAFSLKCLSNFWRTLKMPLTNYEISLDLTWS